MSTTAKQRKSRFLKALDRIGKRQADVARELGISAPHFSLVLNGHRESVTLSKKIDAFIREAEKAA